MSKRRYQTTADVERMASAGVPAPAAGGWRKAILVAVCIIGGLAIVTGLFLAL
jgi:hypothetical protein